MSIEKPAIEILWFKRDLRVQDHTALNAALTSVRQSSAALLPLYIIEHQAWKNPDASFRQWQFVVDCLITLNEDLLKIGQPLQVYSGEAVNVLKALSKQYNITNLWSHQETGNAWSFQRDLAVNKWCEANHVIWHQPTQHPIKRGRLNRNHYSLLNQDFFNLPILLSPQKQILQALFTKHTFNIKALSAIELSMHHWANENTQRGGRHRAEKTLSSFLQNRSERYLQTIAKPLTAPRFSSRLSPHLAWGSLSIREVMFATYQAISQSNNAFNKRNLRAFYERLHWQSHFMQKLESEPEIEFEAMHPLFNNLRPWNEQAQQYYQAWSTGQTGFPMVDACMRCLIQTGWLPFRMRAMVMSFASYQLWLPWQKTAPYLASLFTDYEPGIHYSQVQMQSGVTGINQMRVYNPIKQSHDQDPQGEFIKQWCQELSVLSPDEIHAPWLTQDELFTNKIELGVDYPAPIVEHESAARDAKKALHEIRKRLEAKPLSNAVFVKHGSRRKLPKKPRYSKKISKSKQLKKFTQASVPNNQLSLF